MSRVLLALALGVPCALAAASAAGAKDGVTARLDRPLRLDAPAGARITIAWSLSYVERGRRHPFGASGLFVRVRSASGGAPVKAPARERALGHYVAEATVPAGGIAGVDFGLAGIRRYADGRTEPADVYFPLERDPPAAAGKAGGPPAWMWLAAGGALAAIAMVVTLRHAITTRLIKHGPSA